MFLGVRPVFFDQWHKIDQVEQERGRELGKPREKIISVKEMLNIAYQRKNKDRTEWTGLVNWKRWLIQQNYWCKEMKEKHKDETAREKRKEKAYTVT